MKKISNNDYHYIIEYIIFSNYAKVSAVDPISYHEVCVVGSRYSNRELLTRLAIKKLQNRMRELNCNSASHEKHKFHEDLMVNQVI